MLLKKRGVTTAHPEKRKISDEALEYKFLSKARKRILNNSAKEQLQEALFGLSYGWPCALHRTRTSHHRMPFLTTVDPCLTRSCTLQRRGAQPNDLWPPDPHLEQFVARHSFAPIHLIVRWKIRHTLFCECLRQSCIVLCYGFAKWHHNQGLRREKAGFYLKTASLGRTPWPSGDSWVIGAPVPTLLAGTPPLLVEWFLIYTYIHTYIN